METVKFYSSLAQKEIEAEVLEKRKKTWKLRILESDIFRKVEKRKQIIKEFSSNIPIFAMVTEVKIIKKKAPEKIIIKRIKELNIIDD